MAKGKRTKGQEELEDTKGVIRSRKSKDAPPNGQKKKNKSTNNDLQNITQKTKDRATRTLLWVICQPYHGDNKVHFDEMVLMMMAALFLCQHDLLDYCSTSSLKEQPFGRRVAQNRHIILIPSIPIFARRCGVYIMKVCDYIATM